MRLLHYFTALCALVAGTLAQDLRALLSKEDPGANISVVLPSEPNYANASRPFAFILFQVS